MKFLSKNRCGGVHWTNHSQYKMAFYRLSEGLVKRILRAPKRVEEGVAHNTIAMMQPAGTKKNSYEVWVMAQYENQKSKFKNLDNQRVIKIISVWRYPGKTKPRSEVISNILSSEYNEYNSEQQKAAIISGSF